MGSRSEEAEEAWVRLALVDVEIPGARRFEHHVVRVPRPAAGTVVYDPERGVLLLWRHRFITDSWGWEVPGGGIDAGETPEQGAAREVLEETGRRAGPLKQIAIYHPSNGLNDQTFYVFVADGAEYVGEPADPSESERVEWLPLRDVRRLVRDGSVRDGLSLTALSMAFLFELPERADVW